MLPPQGKQKIGSTWRLCGLPWSLCKENADFLLSHVGSKARARAGDRVAKQTDVLVSNNMMNTTLCLVRRAIWLWVRRRGHR